VFPRREEEDDDAGERRRASVYAFDASMTNF
jgi:hypothetical protein